MAVHVQKVMIKGTRDGLTLRLDDQCSFDDLIEELNQKLSTNGTDEEPMLRVSIHAGKRYLTDEQKALLSDIIKEKQRLVVDHFESEVMTKQEALEWKENTEIIPVVKTVRSGQVVEVRGDLLLIGDVNPGAEIRATGNVFVLGKLLGIAHAGTNGDRSSVIAASYLKPNQLRIAEFVMSPTHMESEGVYMECGVVDDDDQIRFDRLQEVLKKRPDLASFERRMNHG